MLADPITVTAAAPTPITTWSVVRSDGLGSERIDTTGGGYSSVINHQRLKGGGARHYVKITQVVDAVNPYTGLTSKKSATVSMSFFVPEFGFDDTKMVALITLLRDFVYDTEVTPAKLLQFQS